MKPLSAHHCLISLPHCIIKANLQAESKTPLPSVGSVPSPLPSALTPFQGRCTGLEHNSCKSRHHPGPSPLSAMWLCVTVKSYVSHTQHTGLEKALSLGSLSTVQYNLTQTHWFGRKWTLTYPSTHSCVPLTLYWAAGTLLENHSAIQHWNGPFGLTDPCQPTCLQQQIPSAPITFSMPLMVLQPPMLPSQPPLLPLVEMGFRI